MKMNPTPKNRWFLGITGTVIIGGATILACASRAFSQDTLTPPDPPDAAAGFLVPESPVEPETLELECESVGQGTIRAGAALYILQPVFESNPAYSTLRGFGTSDTSVGTTEFDWGFHAAPKIWLSLGGDCLSLRGSYFQFSQDARSIALTGGDPTGNTLITTPQTLGSSVFYGLFGFSGYGSPSRVSQASDQPDQLQFDSSLDLHVADFEVTRVHCVDNTAFEFSGGVRYLDLRQGYSATLTNDGPAGSEFQSEILSHRFRGAGPTAAVTLRAPMFDSPISLFGQGRGSILVGSGDRSQRVSDTFSLPPTAGATNFTDTSSHRDLIPTCDLELGLEYSRPVFGGMLLDARTSLVTQTYFGAGNATSEQGHLSLFGAQVGIGVSY